MCKQLENIEKIIASYSPTHILRKASEFVVDESLKVSVIDGTNFFDAKEMRGYVLFVFKENFNYLEKIYTSYEEFKLEEKKVIIKMNNECKHYSEALYPQLLELLNRAAHNYWFIREVIVEIMPTNVSSIEVLEMVNDENIEN